MPDYPNTPCKEIFRTNGVSPAAVMEQGTHRNSCTPALCSTLNIMAKATQRVTHSFLKRWQFTSVVTFGLKRSEQYRLMGLKDADSVIIFYCYYLLDFWRKRMTKEQWVIGITACGLLWVVRGDRELFAVTKEMQDKFRRSNIIAPDRVKVIMVVVGHVLMLLNLY